MPTKTINHKLEELESKHRALATSLREELAYEERTGKTTLLLSRGYSFQIKKLEKLIYETKRRAFAPSTRIESKFSRELARRKNAIGVGSSDLLSLQYELTQISLQLENPLGQARTAQQEREIYNQLRAKSKQISRAKTTLATRKRALKFWEDSKGSKKRT